MMKLKLKASRDEFSDLCKHTQLIVCVIHTIVVKHLIDVMNLEIDQIFMIHLRSMTYYQS